MLCYLLFPKNIEKYYDYKILTSYNLAEVIIINMSSNDPSNIPHVIQENPAMGSPPQAVWMPYGFVQFDGTADAANSSGGGNPLLHAQGVSPYSSVIFQQPFHLPAQVSQNDPNLPGPVIIPPFPLISSPPPQSNFPRDSGINRNSSLPQLDACHQGIMLSPQIPMNVQNQESISPNIARNSMIISPPPPPIIQNPMNMQNQESPSHNIARNSMLMSPPPPIIQNPINMQGQESASRNIARNSMIMSPPPPIPPVNDNSGQQFQPVFQPMLIGWQSLQQPPMSSNFIQPNGVSQQQIVPDVIGYQCQMDNTSLQNNSISTRGGFQQFPPDVIPGQQQDQQANDYTISEQQQHQPMYANDASGRAQSVLPTSKQEEPSYMNDDDIKRNSRGISMPPLLDQLEPPIAPPRSRRDSRRGSMISLNNLSTQSLDLIGLSERLKGISENEKSTSGEVKKFSLPKRPPRKKDFLRKAVLGQSLPRSFKNLSIICEDLPQYDVPPAQIDETSEQVNGDVSTKCTSQNSDLVISEASISSQTVDVSTTDVCIEKPNPVIAQPGTILRNPVGRSNSLEVRLSVPMPGTRTISPSHASMPINKSLSTHDVPRQTSAGLVNKGSGNNLPFIAQPTGSDNSVEKKLPHLGKLSASNIPTLPIIVPEIVPVEEKIEVSKLHGDVREESIDMTNTCDSQLENETKIVKDEYVPPNPDYQNVDNEKMNKTFLYSAPITDGGNLPDLSTLLSRSPIGINDCEMPKTKEAHPRSDPAKNKKSNDNSNSSASNTDKGKNGSHNVANEEAHTHWEFKKNNDKSVYATPNRGGSHKMANQNNEASEKKKENPYETVEYTNAVIEFDKMISTTPQNYETRKQEDEESDEEFELIEAPESEQRLFREEMNKQFRKAFYGIEQEEKINNGIDIKTEISDEEEREDVNEIVDSDVSPAVQGGDDHKINLPNSGSNDEIQPNEEDSSGEEEASDSDTETLDVTIDLDNDHDTVDDFFAKTNEGSERRSKSEQDASSEADAEKYNEIVYHGANFSWEEVDGAGDNMPPALLLHSRLR